MVAWLEILSGVFMLGDITAAFLSSGGTGAVTLRTGALIALGTLGLWAGIALFRSSKFAWPGSIVVQFLQIPVFFVGTILYRPGLGVFVPLGADKPDMDSVSALYEFTIGIDFMVSHSAVHGQQYVAVNVAALACLVILLLNRPAVRTRV